MRVLVTGGAGYIGSHTCLALREAGHEVAILDNFANAHRGVLSRLEELSGEAIPVVDGDIRNPEALARAFDAARPEAVIHFAGLKAVGEAERRPLDYFDVNLGGTLTLLRAMDAAGCRQIVFSSSATVYGPPEAGAYDEDHPTRPTSVYGRSKLAAEMLISDWTAAVAGASGTLLRYFNPVGAHPSSRIGEDPTGVPDNLMPFVAQVAVGRRPEVAIFGEDYDTADGTGERDYIHVSDLARAHVAALDHGRAQPGRHVFNLGTGTKHSVREVIATFARVSGRPVPSRVAPRRAGDLPAYFADPSRAVEALGWQARHDLAEMCRSTWRWQSANPQGYRGNGEDSG